MPEIRGEINVPGKERITVGCASATTRDDAVILDPDFTVALRRTYNREKLFLSLESFHSLEMEKKWKVSLTTTEDPVLNCEIIVGPTLKGSIKDAQPRRTRVDEI